MKAGSSLTSKILAEVPFGFDLRNELPNSFYGKTYLGVDEAGWNWPPGYNLDGTWYARNNHALCNLSDAVHIQKQLSDKRSVIISISVALEGKFPESIAVDLSQVKPGKIEPGWQLLGFDIANEWFDSVFVTMGGRNPKNYGDYIEVSGLLMSMDGAFQAKDQIQSEYPLVSDLNEVRSGINTTRRLFVFAVYLVTGTTSLG